jgi:tetratricopeptide (TPR) repeat protein
LLEKASGADPQLPSTLTEDIAPEEVVNLPPQRNGELSRLDALYAAQAMLLHARSLNPLLVDNTLNLARFYLPELPVNTPARTALAERANRYYGQAIRLSPNQTTLWNEWARFDLEYRNDPDAAIAKLQHSLALEPEYAPTLLQLGQTHIAKNDLNQAAKVYQRALALKAPPPEAYSKLAFVYYQQGQLAQAAQAFADYIQAAPDAINLWEARKNLALIYKQMGDIPAALREAQAAGEQAPAEARAGLTQMVEQLRAQAAAP